jgi:hypothetical protein
LGGFVHFNICWGLIHYQWGGEEVVVGE